MDLQKIIPIILLTTFIHTNTISRDNSGWQERWQSRVDSISQLSGDITIAEVIRVKPRVYLSACFSTFPDPFDKAKKAFIFYHDSLANVLKYLNRWELVPDSSTVIPTYYLESSFGVARAWVLLVQDSLVTDDSTYLVESYSRNSDSLLNEIWEEECKGLFKVAYEEYQITWTIHKIDESNVRVGVNMVMRSDSYVPRWLYNIVIKRILPKMLDDIRAAMEKWTAGS